MGCTILVQTRRHILHSWDLVICTDPAPSHPDKILRSFWDHVTSAVVSCDQNTKDLSSSHVRTSQWWAPIQSAYISGTRSRYHWDSIIRIRFSLFLSPSMFFFLSLSLSLKPISLSKSSTSIAAIMFFSNSPVSNNLYIYISDYAYIFNNIYIYISELLVSTVISINSKQHTLW